MPKTYTAAGTVSAGDVYTAAAHNIIATDVNNLIVPPVCALTRTTNQLCANNTDTPIQFGTSNFDTDSMGTTGASAKITIKTPGVYQVSYHLSFANIGTGVATAFFMSWVKLNASARRYAQNKLRGQNSFDVHPRFTGAVLMDLVLNDELTLVARQEGYVAGINVTVGDDEYGYPQLSAVWVGRTS
jgi:hypothetical protein